MRRARQSGGVLWLLALLGAGWVAPRPAQAADPLGEGSRALRSGRYAEARTLLGEALVGPTRGEALERLGELELTVGDLAAAEGVAAEAALVPGLEATAALLRGRALAGRGRYEQALAAYAEALATDRELTEARVRQGELLLELGRRAEARRLLEPVVADGKQGGHATPSERVLFGRAAVLLGRDALGFAAFDEVTVREPDHVEANLELGRTALAKEDVRHARQGFEAVLRVNPHHPEAHLGLAELVFLSDNDFDVIEAELAAVAEVAPHHPGAARLRAELRLADGEVAGAQAALAPLLAFNPADRQALALLAASYDLQDDRTRRDEVAARALKLNPRDAAFWETLARVAERANRYPDAVAHARRARKLDPDHVPALSRLGIGLTRLGREDEARRLLEQSYERDGYALPVVNLLNLFERALGDYVVWTTPGGRFRLRAERRDAVLLQLFAWPLLEQTAARYRRELGFAPASPVGVELFHRPELFGVRSLGLPAVASHGISFGTLLTARSPSSGEFSWGQVLTHELSHVFGMQASNYRVPRWLTEGLAEYQSAALRPEWSRHEQQALARAVRAGRLPRLEGLNRSFTHATSLGDVVVAYHQAALLVRFLIEVWGLPAVAGLHRRVGQGVGIERALQELTGEPVATLDRRFLAWLGPKLPLRQGSFDVDPLDYREAAPRRARLQAAPDDPTALAGWAAHLLLRPAGPAGSADPREAFTVAQRALERDPRQPLALYVAGMAAATLGRGDEAIARLEALLAQGPAGPEVGGTLGELLLTARELPRAQRALRAALADAPDEARLWRLLAATARGLADEAGEEEALERLAALDPHDPDPPLLLAGRRLSRGDLDGAARYAEQALYCALFRPATHQLLARIELGRHHPEPALTHAFAASWLASPAWTVDHPAEAGPALPLPDELGPAAGTLAVVSAALRQQGRLAAAEQGLRRRLKGRLDAPGVQETLRALATGAGPSGRPGPR